MISTLHYDDNVDEGTAKPENILFCNQTKSGVDVIDRMSGVCRTPPYRFLTFSHLTSAGLKMTELFTSNQNKEELPLQWLRNMIAPSIYNKGIIPTAVIIRP
jgi:hypothetical protein